MTQQSSALRALWLIPIVIVFLLLVSWLAFAQNFDIWQDRTELTRWPEPAVLTVVATGTADAQAIAATANLRVHTIIVKESAVTPAAAVVIIRHGTTATDPIVAELDLIANGEKELNFTERGLALASGIFIDRVSGSTQLALGSSTVQ